jgi:hypothetical protein
MDLCMNSPPITKSAPISTTLDIWELLKYAELEIVKSAQLALEDV